MMTDTAFRDSLSRSVGLRNGSVVGSMNPLSRGTLNAAFVQGKAKTLWLSNTRRGTPATVDSKILAGEDLQFALDPLLDQTFLFSAVRCLPPAAVYGQSIGLSPRKCTVWAGSSNDFSSFCDSVILLLKMVDRVATPIDDPLPVLATPLQDSASMANIADAYDAAIVPMDLLDSGLSAGDRAEAEKWSQLSFEVTSSPAADLVAEIALPDAQGIAQPLGTIQLTFDLTSPDRIGVTASLSAGAPVNNAAEIQLAIEMINSRQSWLRVWYDSGHGFSDGSFSLMRLRDRPFPYSWADFATFNVGKEKPSPLTTANIGAQDSLFCWVQQNWRQNLNPAMPNTGWLACNDGAQEIADFIHLDDATRGMVVLTLIHVKASKKSDPGRQISVSDFEIVVSQAEKNLRFLEMHWLSGEFVQFLSKKLFNAVWHNGAPALRKDMIAALKKVPFPDQLRVVVLQPRITQTAVANARQAVAGTRAYRAIRQLDTLLLSAGATCRGIGAEFQVIGGVI